MLFKETVNLKILGKLFDLHGINRIDLYLYGFNGMEKDDEVKGGGNSYDFGARVYDPRLGRWLSMDPLQAKFPELSPYNFVTNNPIVLIDPDGNEPREGNQVLKVNFDKCMIIKIGDDNAKFTTYDKSLRIHSFDYFAQNTTIGGRMRFNSPTGGDLYRAISNNTKLYEVFRQGLSNADVGNQFLRASKSSTGYDYLEISDANN
ncbi:MAG: RHS repeat-associated core domain-containing protein [Bacteroidetes bacterium]|nr:RHS repeat-associated core domain-containing protein [Bacteroidota bacterium]